MKTLLLVEDSEDDFWLTDVALKSGGVEVDLQIATTGPDALAYLRREGKHANARRPDLILLDLNLPGISGLDVLREIKIDQDLLDIPVVILTTSNNPDDVKTARDLGVAQFYTKTVDFGPFNQLITRIGNDWFADEIPPNDPQPQARNDTE